MFLHYLLYVTLFTLCTIVSQLTLNLPSLSIILIITHYLRCYGFQSFYNFRRATKRAINIVITEF